MANEFPKLFRDGLPDLVVFLIEQKGENKMIRGYRITIIDTDPDEHLAMTLKSFKLLTTRELIAVIPRQFTEFRSGYLVISYDKEEDVTPEYPEIKVTEATELGEKTKEEYGESPVEEGSRSINGRSRFRPTQNRDKENNRT